MKHRFLYIMALLLTVATGAWAQDPDPIDLTPSADGTVWTLSTMPEYDVELEVTYYTDAELDQMAADEVIAKITAIGTVTYTPESKALIDAARTAYDALTAAQQALVTNYSTLTDAETTYATAEETAYTEGVELTKNPDGTWSLAATPGFDVELEVEYKADLTLTVNIEGWTFGATANTPTVSGNEGSGAVTFEYKNKGAADDSYSTDVPTDAGEYTVRATVAETDDYVDGTATADFTIAKAAATISYETASVSKTYGDADFTNDLTNTGNGTVTYTSNNESVATVNSETGLVTITGAPGEATITATVTDGTNYAYATATATFSVGVNSAAITVSAEGFTGTYDSKSHTITVTVTEPEGTTVKYGTTAGEYTLDEAPAYTDAGEYTIYYQVTKANYTTVENSAVVSIQKAAASISYETTAVSKTTNDEAFVNALTMTGDGTVTYSSDNVNVATVNSETGEVTIKGTGNATIKATVVDGTNYTYATKTAQYTLTVEAATGISDVKTDATENANWYDLSGRPLNGKPTKAGVYVKNGKKVVIK